MNNNKKKKEKMETKIGEVPGATRVRRTKERFFLRTPERAWPYEYFDFRLLASRTTEK
jgi:hypothetical protein